MIINSKENFESKDEKSNNNKRRIFLPIFISIIILISGLYTILLISGP